MATIAAQASGNWSDAGTWAGGMKPGPGDIATTSTYVVTIDENIECASVTSTGTGYYAVAVGGLTLTTSFVSSATHSGYLLRCTHSSGTVVITGDVTAMKGGGLSNDNEGGVTILGTCQGGTASNIYGAYNAGAGTMTITTCTGGANSYAYGIRNAGTGIINITTCTGGTGTSSHGAYNNGSGTINITTCTGGTGSSSYGAYNNGSGTTNITTCTGGTVSSSYGVFNNGSGTTNITTCTGGTGTSSHGAYNNGSGTVNVDLAVGNSYGPGSGTSNGVVGVFGKNIAGQITTVKAVQYGPYGQSPTGGAVKMIPDGANNFARFVDYPSLATIKLITPDYPVVGDVRLGTDFDYGDMSGTLAVPAANQVAVGIAVDDKTGTAVLTADAAAAAVWDAAKVDHTNAGSFGEEVQTHATSAEMAAIMAGTISNVTIVSAVSGNTITVYNDDTWAFSLANTNLAMSAYEVLAFVVKASALESDADAILLLRSDTGLVRIGGAAPTSAANGTLVMNSATEFSVLVAVGETSSVSHYGSFTWWLKGFDTTPTPDTAFTLATGTFDIIRTGYQAIA